MKKSKLVIMDKIPLLSETLSELDNKFQIIHYPYKSLKNLYKKHDDAEIVWVRLDHFLSENFFNKMNNLRIIATNTTGLTHIDLNCAKNKKIKILNLQPNDKKLNTITSTTEHAITLMYMLIRKANLACLDIGKGNWNRNAFQGRELIELNVGIIGFGRIGKQIFKRLKNFSNKISYYDINKKINTYCEHKVTLKDLLNKSDIIFLCIKEEKQNINFFNSKTSKMLLNKPYIINISRGSIIDQDYYIKLLKNNKISGLALDVIKEENNDHDLYLSLKAYKAIINKYNLIITPHIAGNTIDAWRKSEKIICEKILANELVQ